MVAEAPFVGWYHVKYPLQGSPTEGFYYVYTAALVRINPLSSRFPEEGIKPACVEISYHFGNSDKDVGSVPNAIQDTCVGHSLIPLVPRRINSLGCSETWILGPAKGNLECQAFGYYSF